MFGFAIDGLPAKSELNTIESITKIRPRLVMFYLQWPLEMLRYAKSHGLAALIWFQVNKEIDWRLETGVSESVRSLIDMENRSAAWRAVLLDR